MAEISASTVMKLRKMSGQGMMDCKRALQEADGDVDQAMDVLRKKGLATLAKRAQRETTEGLVVSWQSGDGKMAGLATLCCETDFVAKSDDFRSLLDWIQSCIGKCPDDQDVAKLRDTEHDGKSFGDRLTETVSRTGEKMQVGEYARFKLDGPGLISTYIHFNGKVGAMVQIDTSDDGVAGSDVLRRTGNDIAMHITASNPLEVDRDRIRPEKIEQEKAIFAEQVANKPPQIIEKIVEGKMRKFYSENCLLEQPFVKDDSQSVQQVLADAAKEAGGEAKIKRFVRFEVG